jgi:alkylation response protein AidB-like acyl-CoA dehydrogenase
MSDWLGRAERVAARIAERAASYDEAAAFPAEDVDDLRAEGLLGLLVPAHLEGGGAGFAEYVEVAAALARGSGATALLFNMHAAVTGGLAGITDELAAALGATEAFAATRDRVLTHAVEGRMYGVAISEAGAGSRLSELRTSYTSVPEGFRVRGEKVACSGAGHLDGYLVAARAEDADEQTVSYFFVEPGPGLAAEGDWDPLGMRATASRRLRIDAVVPEANLLGGVEGLGLLLAYTMPQWLVASYAAVYVGVAEAAVAAAAEHLLVRRERGSKVSSAMRTRLGRADATAAAARLAVEHAARLVDSRPGEPDTNVAVYRAKLLAGDAAMEAAASVSEACGLHALSRGAPLERLYRDARLGAVMPPRSDICAELLGTSALGLEPEKEMEDPPW